jgi:hypothetical protein
MKRMIVQYRVKPERAVENQQAIERVFAELRATDPGGVRYVSFKGGDGVTFMHLVSVETASGENPLDQLPSFKAFQAGVGDRWAEPPTFTTLEEVGSYRVFGS